VQSGLSRRLSTMVHMVQAVLEFLSPALEYLPEAVSAMDAMACIQTSSRVVCGVRPPDENGRQAGLRPVASFSVICS
jgi:hypothetical protein